MIINSRIILVALISMVGTYLMSLFLVGKFSVEKLLLAKTDFIVVIIN